MIDATAIRAIFLDDGGVMNDNTLRGPEWERLVGEYLSPRLGGTVKAWGEANNVVFAEMWRQFEALLHPVLEADSDTYFDFFGDQRARWLRDMCDRVGVAAPDAGQCRELALETEQFVLPRVRCAYPGAADAIRELHKRGYRLGTASGGTARELEGYVGSLGVRDLFPERLYGADLVRALKATTHYYRRIFQKEGLDPAETLVVDDLPLAVARASAVGATTVLVAHKPPSDHKADFVIARLADLPALLER